MPDNYFHQSRSTVGGQEPGFPQRGWLVEADWILSPGMPIGNSGAEAVTIETAHYLKPGKGWLQLYALPHSVTAAFKAAGEPGAMLGGEWEPQALWPGDTPELQQMVEQLKTGDYVLLLEDREAGPNKYLQFGTKEQPLNFKEVAYESGTSKEGVKGWRLTGGSTKRYFYRPEVDNTGLHSDTIIFLNQLLWEEEIDLTLEQTLYLDRLVRDLHGEFNPDYDTYDVWSLGVAVYPVIGGVPEAHKYNLLNPLDDDAAYRLTWDGANGEVHDASGIAWDGASWADTYIVPDVVFGADEGCHGYYVVNLSANGRNEYGVVNSGSDFSQFSVDLVSEKLKYGVHTTAPVASLSPVTPPVSRAFTVNRKTGADEVSLFAAGGIAHTTADVATVNAQAPVYLGKKNGDALNLSETTVGGYWFFHTLPGDAEVLALNDAMEAFNAGLGR